MVDVAPAPPLDPRLLGDPIWFIERVLGVRLYHKQRQVIRRVWGLNDDDQPDDAVQRRTSVVAAHSVGKTMLAACLTVAWLMLHEQAVVITTAPTGRQVKQLLWREIRARVRDAEYDLADVKPLTQEWNISEDRFAIGFATDEGPKFQGYHAKHVLIIVDEASGVSDEIFEAIEGVLLGGNAHLLLIGNGNVDVGELFESQEGENSVLYNSFQISVADTPLWTGEAPEHNWGDFLITPKAAAELAQKYKNHPNVLRVRLYAQFPTMASDQVISTHLVQQAYDVKRPDGAKVAGVDVAVGGEDSTGFVLMNGDRLEEMHLHGLDSVNKNVDTAKEWLNDLKHRGLTPTKIVVDANGVGKGVYDYLAVAKYPVGAFYAQGQPRDRRRFADAASEAWWTLREELEKLNISLKRDDPLANLLRKELTGAVFVLDAMDRIKVDKKGRNKESPNLADALIMAVVQRKRETPSPGLYNAGGRQNGGAWGNGGSRGMKKRAKRRDHDKELINNDPNVLRGYVKEDGTIYEVR